MKIHLNSDDFVLVRSQFFIVLIFYVLFTPYYNVNPMYKKMALVPNSKNSLKGTSLISYVSVAEFSNNFFNYYTTLEDLQTVGHLDPVAGASGNCPAGRILRENGRKLYPGGAYPSVTTYLVGVYDSKSLLSGFIDPNAPQFALYNTDKPNTVPNGDYTSGAITGKTITATGSGLDSSDATVTVTNGSVVVDNGSIVVSNGQIRASNVVSATITGNYTVIPSLAQIFNISLGDAIGATVSINIANSTNTQIGAIVHLNIANGRDAGDCTVTFTNTGDGANGVRTPGTLLITNTQMFSVAFLIVNNGHVVEISRTAAMTSWL